MPTMKAFVSKYLIALIAVCCLTTACHQEEWTTDIEIDAVAQSEEAFSGLEAELGDVLALAIEHDWFDHGDLLSDLLKPNRSFTAEDIESLESNLGISFDEFERLTTDLAIATDLYMEAVQTLEWSTEEQARLIYETVSSSDLLHELHLELTDENGRCFFQNACYLIGGFLIEVYLALFCDFFCEEEALPFYILLDEICQNFAC